MKKLNTNNFYPAKNYFHDNTTLKLFLNELMKKGKKNNAEKLLENSLNILKKHEFKNPIRVLFKAIETFKPFVYSKQIRRGRYTLNIPAGLKEKKQQTSAIKWIIDGAKKRGKKNFSQNLAEEIIDILNNKGFAIKFRDESFNLANTNKANLRTKVF